MLLVYLLAGWGALDIVLRIRAQLQAGKPPSCADELGSRVFDQETQYDVPKKPGDAARSVRPRSSL